MNLEEIPESYTATRDALHQLAFFAVAPARYRVTERMGLTATPGGFGTPRFDSKIARVEGDSLVLETREAVASQQITTVRAACEFFGHEYESGWFTGFRDPLQPVDPDLSLDVDDVAARAIGQWFNYGYEVLDRVRAHGVDGDDISDVQLWPEHFDPATELGDSDKGQRASYGASPGDDEHPTPYVYVSPWGEVDTSDTYWNDEAFGGSSLGYVDLASADDPVGLAVDFLLEGYRRLHAG